MTIYLYNLNIRVSQAEGRHQAATEHSVQGVAVASKTSVSVGFVIHFDADRVLQVVLPLVAAGHRLDRLGNGVNGKSLPGHRFLDLLRRLVRSFIRGAVVVQCAIYRIVAAHAGGLLTAQTLDVGGAALALSGNGTLSGRVQFTDDAEVDRWTQRSLSALDLFFDFSIYSISVDQRYCKF